MTDLPAVQNDRSDVVAMNPLARALYSGMLPDSPGPWNHARYIHLDPGARSFYRDWDEIASSSAAWLNVAAARNPVDSELSNLIGELATRSEDFRVRWASRDVHEHRAGVKRLHHELVGDIDLVYETLALSGDPGLTLFVYVAEPGSPSADALRLLAAWSTPLESSVPHPQREHHD